MHIINGTTQVMSPNITSPPSDVFYFKSIFLNRVSIFFSHILSFTFRSMLSYFVHLFLVSPRVFNHIVYISTNHHIISTLKYSNLIPFLHPISCTISYISTIPFQSHSSSFYQISSLKQSIFYQL
jgi:hypothetical protein